MGSGIPLCRIQFYSAHCTRKHFKQIYQFYKLRVQAYLSEVREICENCDHRSNFTFNFMSESIVINSDNGFFNRVFNLFLPNVPFRSPWKLQKTIGSLMFSGGSKGNIGKKRVNHVFTQNMINLQ